MRETLPPPPDRFIAGRLAEIMVIDVMEARNVRGLVPPPSAARVEQRLKQVLIEDPGVSAHGIDVDVREGIVTLSGHTSSLPSKRRAAYLARMLRGVERVLDEIVVDPSLSDPRVRTDVSEALRELPGGAISGLDIRVSGGRVVLQGQVRSHRQKRLLDETIANVAGVTEVDLSGLEVERSDAPSGQALATAVEARFQTDARLAATPIRIGAEGSAVQLRGSVRSAEERGLAKELALEAGATSVVADLSVSPLKAIVRKPRVPDDAALQEWVVTRLEDPVWSDRARIEVDVNDAQITLFGHVETLAEKATAARIATNTAGARSVVNLLQVRPVSELEERAIAARVERALARDPYVSDAPIEAFVADRMVYLSGTVATGFQRRRAERAASSVYGVVDVKTAIQAIYPGPRQLDQQIETEIERRLWWNPLVDAATIDVKVRDGAVVLDGSVRDHQSRRAALRTARAASPGRVVDQLEVDESSLRQTSKQ